MHDELDGVATPEESSKLQEHLARDPEAKARFEHLRQLSAMLDRVEMVDPPPDLKAGILRSIRTRATSEPARVGWLDRLAAAFGGRPLFRFAYSFAAGVAAGIIGFAVFSGNFASRPQPGADRFSGTMAPLFRSEAHRKVDSRKFDFAEGSVAIETRLTDAGVALVVEARSASEIGLRLEFEPADYSVVGLTQSSGIQCRAMIGEGKVILTHSGEGHYVISLARRGQSTSPVRVSIHAPDGLREGALQTGGVESGK
jgi:anti-sigma factor RsiW